MLSATFLAVHLQDYDNSLVNSSSINLAVTFPFNVVTTTVLILSLAFTSNGQLGITKKA
jgi:hypothetical protein